MRFAASSLVAVLTAVVVAAQPLTPELSANSPIAHPSVPQTNAERFAARLPPLPPSSRHSRGPHGGSRAATARRAAVSPGVPVNVKCNILVKERGGAKLGYLSSKWTFGIYGTLQSSKAGALEVGISYIYNDPSSLSQVDVVASNGPNNAYPYLGGISTFAGSGDIGPWSPAYQYVGGTKQSKKGPSETVGTSMDPVYNSSYKSQSAIWKYNPSTQEISVQWINSDGTSPASYLVYTSNLLRITGMSDNVDMLIDPTAVFVTFTCETPATS